MKNSPNFELAAFARVPGIGIWDRVDRHGIGRFLRSYPIQHTVIFFVFSFGIGWIGNSRSFTREKKKRPKKAGKKKYI